jgi:hypothetical protein
MHSIIKLAPMVIALSIGLAGCAGMNEVDAIKLSSNKSVTVVYPGKTSYGAGAASAPLIIPGGIVAALITGAANASASNTNKKAETFDELVAEKVGDTNLNRQFTGGVEDSLRDHGYVVNEVSADAPTLPTFTRDKHTQWQAEGQAYRDSDAVLIIKVSPGYQAPGPLNSYSRMIVGEIVMFKGDTHEAVLRRRLYWQKFTDPYSYGTYAFIKDLPHAIKGLDEAELAQVDTFDKALTAVQQH